MAVLAISSARVRKGYASRAQQVTLAAAVFDKQGRILVTSDGILPSEEITETFMQKTQDDVFSTAHPLFQWAYQASRNWSSVSDLIGKMTRHVARLPHHGRNIRTGIDLVNEEGHIINNYDTVFRELFCLAASALAAKLGEQLNNSGSLWDEIFQTGGPIRSSVEEHERTPTSSSSDAKHQDMAEKGMAFQPRQDHGSMMLLVRHVESARDVDRLESAGYRFAEVHQVAGIIGSTMQIRTSRLEQRLQFMAKVDQQTMLDPGVHLALFALRPRVDMFGYDVLVREPSHNLLPSVWVPLDRIDSSDSKFLRRFDGQTLSAAWQLLSRPDAFPQNTRIAALFRDAVQDSRSSLSDGIFDDAKFVATAVQAPCNSPTDAKPLTCSLLTFSIVLPPTTVILSTKFRFIPLQLLKTQQLVYANSPHHAAFARLVHREIVPVLNEVPPAVPTKVPISSSHRRNFVPLTDSAWPSFGRLGRGRASSRVNHARSDSAQPVTTNRAHLAQTSTNDSVASIQLYAMTKEQSSPSSDEDLKPQYDETSANINLYGRTQQSSFGGIMISSEVTVDVEDASRQVPSPVEPRESRSRSNSNLAIMRQKSQRNVLQRESEMANMPIDGKNVGAQGGGNKMTASYEQTIELKDVSSVLGVGLSRVVVQKEDEVTTFIDDLLAQIDTPRRT